MCTFPNANTKSFLVRSRSLAVCMHIALSCCAQISESYVCSFENKSFAFTISPHKCLIALGYVPPCRTSTCMRYDTRESARVRRINARSKQDEFHCFPNANTTTSLVRLSTLSVCMHVALLCCAQISKSYVCSLENESFAFTSSTHKRLIELAHAPSCLR